jgi:hypothetical protein
MNKVDEYIHAATRDNTRRSNQAAVRHFETAWGDSFHQQPTALRATW